MTVVLSKYSHHILFGINSLWIGQSRKEKFGSSVPNLTIELCVHLSMLYDNVSCKFTHLVPGKDNDDTDADHGDAGDEEDDHDDGEVHDVPQLPGRPVHSVHLHRVLLPLLLSLNIGSLNLGERVVNLEISTLYEVALYLNSTYILYKIK